MPTNFQNFNHALTTAENKIKGSYKRFYRQVCLEVFKRIVMRTPVDTGRAIGNWQIEFGMPASGVIDIIGTENILAGIVIGKAIAKLKDIPLFSNVHITNNVEYIYYLEYVRTSKKHSEGMVEITLTEMANWLYELRQPGLQFTRE